MENAIFRIEFVSYLSIRCHSILFGSIYFIFNFDCEMCLLFKCAHKMSAHIQRFIRNENNHYRLRAGAHGDPYASYDVNAELTHLLTFAKIVQIKFEMKRKRGKLKFRSTLRYPNCVSHARCSRRAIVFEHIKYPPPTMDDVGSLFQLCRAVCCMLYILYTYEIWKIAAK